MHLVVQASLKFKHVISYYVFVRCSMVPSMRSGMYKVKLILKKHLVNEKLVGSVHGATCECAAGYVLNTSSSVIHVHYVHM